MVSGQSMAPTLRDKQLMLVNKTENRFESGNIITFKTKDYGVCVKRIIACGNDVVDMKDGRIYVNNIVVSPYTCDKSVNHQVILDDNQYFVIGDNYNESIDSRVFGPVESKMITGKVIVY